MINNLKYTSVFKIKSTNNMSYYFEDDWSLDANQVIHTLILVCQHNYVVQEKSTYHHLHDTCL